jgi:hypothetical protein
MEEELLQFRRERSERIRQLHTRQGKDIERFDAESHRLGFNALTIAESSQLDDLLREDDERNVSASRLSLVQLPQSTSSSSHFSARFSST